MQPRVLGSVGQESSSSVVVVFALSSCKLVAAAAVVDSIDRSNNTVSG